MRIGLIDVDGHASKKKWGATIYPNIALAKIARYHKEHGDDVEWYSPFSEHYDWVYMSKVFNFSPDYDYTINNADRIIKGGTGYFVSKDDMPGYKPLFGDKIWFWAELPVEIDHCQPDYSIYPHVPSDYAYGFLTRGCPNKCKWCVVPRKEGAIRPYMDVDEIAIEGRHKLVLMDNNFLAAGDYAHEQLDKIIERGYRVDFNQALDARLVTDDFARKLAKVKWLDKNRIRFGCDTKKQIEDCERAMELIISHGFKGEFFFTLCSMTTFRRVMTAFITGGINFRNSVTNIPQTWYMPTRSPTVTRTILTTRYHNGRRIWQTGLIRKRTS